MPENTNPSEKMRIRDLPRNIWAVSFTSFFMDISSEMVINILPLFLVNVLGVKTSIVGLIEGIAESTASLVKLFSGWFSDRMHSRKWLAVVGYGLSALSKPFFLIASTWEAVAVVRWMDRVGKGIRTAPRDALVADSIDEQHRGLAFGFHRAADTAGAVVGILIAILVIWFTQANSLYLTQHTFQLVVLVSLLPAVVAVLTLAIGAREVAVKGQRNMPRFGFRVLGKPFMVFMIIAGIFTLGNSSDAFLTLRAQNAGLTVVEILIMLVVFNLVYSLTSTPAGSISDRIGRYRVIIAGWLIYALIYFGFAISQAGWLFFALYALYGFYYGLTYGTINALLADLVPVEVRGTAYGSYNAMVGILAFPASLIAGILWQGVGNWAGFGPAAPFLFGGCMSLVAALLLIFWMPRARSLSDLPGKS
jgi:MFS family permease